MELEETRPASLSELRVADAMHPGVFTCSLATPLRSVARMMATHRIHCVVVYEHDAGLSGESTPWGIVSDVDLVSVAATEDVDDRTAGGTAVSPVVMIPPDETLERAAQLIREHGMAHLVVVDPASMEPMGVLSTLDIAALLAGLP